MAAALAAAALVASTAAAVAAVAAAAAVVVVAAAAAVGADPMWRASWARRSQNHWMPKRTGARGATEQKRFFARDGTEPGGSASVLRARSAHAQRTKSELGRKQ